MGGGWATHRNIYLFGATMSKIRCATKDVWWSVGGRGYSYSTLYNTFFFCNIRFIFDFSDLLGDFIPNLT